MTTALYRRDGNSAVLVGTFPSGGATVTRTRTTLAAALPAGTSVVVPTHTVGTNNLLIYLDGILCHAGSSDQYIDASTSTITFNDALPSGSEITAVLIS